MRHRTFQTLLIFSNCGQNNYFMLRQSVRLFKQRRRTYSCQINFSFHDRL